MSQNKYDKYTTPTYSSPSAGFDIPSYVSTYYDEDEEEDDGSNGTNGDQAPEGGGDQPTKEWDQYGKVHTTEGAAQHANLYGSIGKDFPSHQDLAHQAGFVGLFGSRAARPGNKAYDNFIDQRKQDMREWGVYPSHRDSKTGKKTGKYSSQDFKDWMALSGGKLGMKKKSDDEIPQLASNQPIVTVEEVLVNNLMPVPNHPTLADATATTTNQNLLDYTVSDWAGHNTGNIFGTNAGYAEAFGLGADVDPADIGGVLGSGGYQDTRGFGIA